MPASTVGNRAQKLDPPLLTDSPISGRVYVVTVGKVRGGVVEATTKYDVTDQFEALAAKRASRAA